MAEKKIKPNCWKVLTIKRNSAAAMNDLKVAYPCGVPVRAPVGGLFVFRTREHAGDA